MHFDALRVTPRRPTSRESLFSSALQQRRLRQSGRLSLSDLSLTETAAVFATIDFAVEEAEMRCVAEAGEGRGRRLFCCVELRSEETTADVAQIDGEEGAVAVAPRGKTRRGRRAHRE
jgi:hypothetical protein